MENLEKAFEEPLTFKNQSYLILQNDIIDVFLPLLYKRMGLEVVGNLSTLFNLLLKMHLIFT